MFIYIYIFIYFFFQAEDGIRDKLVTGVQTCALPILAVPSRPAAQAADLSTMQASARQLPSRVSNSQRRPRVAGATGKGRSEERRVGKECRSRCMSDY